MLYCVTTMEHNPLQYLGIVESDFTGGSPAAGLGLDSDEHQELQELQKVINYEEELAIVAADQRQRRQRSVIAQKIVRVSPVRTIPAQNSSPLNKPHQARKADSEEKLDVACRNEDPELFFSVGKMPEKQAEQAKAICRRCKVIDWCLEYALKEDMRYGVWGGKTEEERSKMKLTRKRRIG